MAEIAIERSVPRPIIETFPALDAALRAALGVKISGARYGKGVVYVVFADGYNYTAEDENTARQTVLTHDFNTRTPSQNKEAARKADFADLFSQKAQDALTEIGTDLDALQGADLATMRQIVRHVLQNQRFIIRGLRYLEKVAQ